MDYVNLLLSAVVGSVAGAVASIATATRIARSGERGRQQEEARQRLLAKVRGYRAALGGRTGLMARHRSLPSDNPMTEQAGMRFAESIELDLPYVTPRLAGRLRQHVATLIGPTDAAIAREVAFLPEDRRHHEWKADTYLRVNNQVEHDRLLSKGLLQKARMYEAPAAAGEAIVAELRGMETTLLSSGSRWGRRRRAKAITPKQVR